MVAPAVAAAGKLVAKKAAIKAARKAGSHKKLLLFVAITLFLQPFVAVFVIMMVLVAGMSAVASVGAATGPVSAEAKANAQTLMSAYQAGKLTDFEPKMITAEIAPMAAGRTVAGCVVDGRVLQLLVLTLNRYGSVGISDLGRTCGGSAVSCKGAAASPHCTDPETAVDFDSLGGQPLMAGEALPLDMSFLDWVNSLAPQGSFAGQSECRTAVGYPASLSNLHGFADFCTHQHIDFRGTTAPLNIAPSS